jgi:hypothetical protein
MIRRRLAPAEILLVRPEFTDFTAQLRLLNVFH